MQSALVLPLDCHRDEQSEEGRRRRRGLEKLKKLGHGPSLVAILTKRVVDGAVENDGLVRLEAG